MTRAHIGPAPDDRARHHPPSPGWAADARAITPGFLDTPAGFGALLLAYLVVHLLLRVLVSRVLTIDDAREAVLGQTLAWGYQARQPPLYNWLVWATFRLVGVSVLSLTLVKYAVLGIAYGFVYASARRILPTPRLATLATFSLLLVFPVSWTVHDALTHSTAVLAAGAATFYAVLRLGESDRLGAYLGLGVAAGLGLLSKYTYAVFAAALALAALTDVRYRRRLFDVRLLLTLALAALMVSPALLWLWRHGHDLGQLYADEVRIERGHTYLGEMRSGLYYIARIALYYLGPLVLTFAVVFPGFLGRVPRSAREAATPVGTDDRAQAGGRLLGRFLGAVFLLLVGGALTGQLAYLKFRWMLPAFGLAPLYAWWRVVRVGYAPERLRWLAGLLLAVAVAIAVTFVGTITVGTRLSGRPQRLAEPYDVLADRLAQAGFGDGTIVAGPGSLVGSLRLRFPRARVLTLEHPQYVPPHEGEGQCLVVWERGDPARVPPKLARFLKTALGVRPFDPSEVRVAETPYRLAPGYIRRIGFVLVPGGVGACR